MHGKRYSSLYDFNLLPFVIFSYLGFSCLGHKVQNYSRHRLETSHLDSSHSIEGQVTKKTHHSSLHTVGVIALWFLNYCFCQELSYNSHIS